jgi:hypothetical protein
MYSIFGYRTGCVPGEVSLSATKDVETFPKANVTKAFVEREKNKQLAAGAIVAEITETPTHWVLTTIWPE